MSAGFLPDLQYSNHSSLDFKPRLCTNARTSLKDRYSRRRVAIVALPSQSPQPTQPASAYRCSGPAGMSAGFLPDLQYSRHSSPDFKPRLCTNARAVLKERYWRKRRATVSVPSQSPQPTQPASAYRFEGLPGMSAGLSPDLLYPRHSVKDFKPRPRTK